MGTNKGKTFLLITDGETLRVYISERRKTFSAITHIASSFDWKFRYAYFKPSKPSREEVSRFLRELEEVKKELTSLKRRFRPRNANLLGVLEKRLKQMLEEYIEYPFSDRDAFFKNRLMFIKNSIRSCFVG